MNKNHDNILKIRELLNLKTNHVDFNLLIKDLYSNSKNLKNITTIVGEALSGKTKVVLGYLESESLKNKSVAYLTTDIKEAQKLLTQSTINPNNIFCTEVSYLDELFPLIRKSLNAGFKCFVIDCLTSLMGDFLLLRETLGSINQDLTRHNAFLLLTVSTRKNTQHHNTISSISHPTFSHQSNIVLATTLDNSYSNKDFTITVKVLKNRNGNPNKEFKISGKFS